MIFVITLGGQQNYRGCISTFFEYYADMLKFEATTVFGLLRLHRMGELDFLDLLEAVPAVAQAEMERAQAEERERRRLAWLESYESDLSLCAEESN